MIRLIQLLDTQVQTSDGQIGRVKDFLVDDRNWEIAKIAVQLDWGMSSRTVLIDPHSAQTDSANEFLTVNLTRQALVESPEIDLSEPAAMETQDQINTSLNWNGQENSEPGSFGLGVGDLSAAPLADLQADLREQASAQENPAIHLRSLKDMSEYHVLSKEGDEIGVVLDFVGDEKDWQILYLVVDTGAWLSGRQVVLSPAWVERVSWAQSLLYFDLSRQAVERSPVFDPDQVIQREYEDALFQHYNRTGYW